MLQRTNEPIPFVTIETNDTGQMGNFARLSNLRHPVC